MMRLVAGLGIVALLVCVPVSTNAQMQDPIVSMIVELGLNQQQIEQIRQLFESFGKKQDALPTVGDVLLKNRETLRGVITGTPFDPAKAQQVAQQVSSVVAQRMVNRLELRNQIFHVLTSTQQEKYVKMVQEALIESQ
jgi:Spy/CpxP family protein refolding chaperone